MNRKESYISVSNKYTKSIFSGFSGALLKMVLMGVTLSCGFSLSAQTGTWTKLTNNAPHDNMGVMLLLTDGTVIAHNSSGPGIGTGWDKLSPDNTGSYTNGTWSSIASMNYDRLFFPSQVLPDGRVFVAGGQYGSGATKGEIYDPVTNVWTNTGAVTGNQNIYNGNSIILTNGVVLVGVQDGPHPSTDNLFYSPETNSWTSAPSSPLSHNEAAWLTLPDGSVVFVGMGSTASCRYLPSTNTWVVDGNLSVKLYDYYGNESGSGIMLPNGKGLFLGATGHNAIYNPSGNATPGTWVAAIDFPVIGGVQMGQVDAPAVMLPNGKILCAVSPIATNPNYEFRSPTYFLEYDYINNSFSQVTATIPGLGTGDSITVACNLTTMLLLPNGTVLMGVSQPNISQYYWIYTPAGTPTAEGKPTIKSMYKNNGINYITGTLFNGISEGAVFGDDWQMATNYPLVRFTNGTNTYYARTTNWNRVGVVQTGNLLDTAQFTLPLGMPAGTYSMVVVANGYVSDPIAYNVPTSVPIIENSISPVNIFPNPSNGNFTITGLISGQIIEVYNTTGQKVSTLIANDVNANLNLTDKIADGVYLVKVLSGNGTLVSESKIIKTN